MKNTKQTIVQDITDTMLAQAYVIVKTAGLKMRVTKLDGVPRKGFKENDDVDINVEVAGGFVRKAWFN